MDNQNYVIDKNAEQNIVAIVHIKKLKFHDVHINNHEWIEWKQPKYDGMELYTAPMHQVDLTDDEIRNVLVNLPATTMLMDKIHAVIAAYKKKNNV